MVLDSIAMYALVARAAEQSPVKNDALMQRQRVWKTTLKATNPAMYIKIAHRSLINWFISV